MRTFKHYILLTFSVLIIFSCQRKNVQEKVTKEYYSSGKLKTKVIYKNPEDTTTYSLYRYYKNGNLNGHYKIKQNKLHGTTYSYYENGNLENITYYKNGKVHGTTYSYYKNGNLENITNYKNGNAHGINKIFNSRGNGVMKRSLYIEGKQKVYEVDMTNSKGWEKRISYLVENREACPVGEIVKDSNGRIIKDKTFFYQLIVQDTVCFREKYTVKVIPILNTCNNKCFVEIRMGKLNQKFNIKKDHEPIIKVLENYDTLTYNKKPEKSGYHQIIGKMLVKSKKDSSTRDILVIFDDIYIKNCKE